MAKKTSKTVQNDKVSNKVLIGTPVMVANSGATWTCFKCGSERRKGIVYRYENADYCSRICITA